MYLLRFLSNFLEASVRLRRLLFARRSSWSQYGEDLIIETYLPQGVGGYLDLGSGRPKRHSNTYLFYKRGWSGTCVDGNPLNTILHRLVRPRDRAINRLISPGYDKSKLDFFLFRRWQLSTMDGELAKSLTDQGNPMQRVIQVESSHPSSFTSAVSPEDNFFLTCDIEGLDFEVIEAMDWSSFRPAVVCTEDLQFRHESLQRSATTDLLTSKGYVLVATTPVSLIFVHESIGIIPKL